MSGNADMYHSVGTQTNVDMIPARRRKVATRLNGAGPQLSAGPAEIVMADDEEQESPAILLTTDLLEKIQAAIQADRELYQDTVEVDRKTNYRARLRKAFQRKRENMDRDEARIRAKLSDGERPEAGTKRVGPEHWERWLKLFDDCRKDITAYCDELTVEEDAETGETDKLRLQHLIASNELDVILDDVFVRARILNKLVVAEPENLLPLNRFAVLQEWNPFEGEQGIDLSSAEEDVEEHAQEVILDYGSENSHERALIELKRQADRGIDPIRRDYERRMMWTEACNRVKQFQMQLSEAYAEHDDHLCCYDQILDSWKHDNNRPSRRLRTRSQFDRNYLLVGREITQAITKAENDLAVAVARARELGLHFDSDGGSYIDEDQEVDSAELNEWGEASIDRKGLQDWVDKVQPAESESAETGLVADEWGARSVEIHESNSMVDGGIYKRRIEEWKRQCNELRLLAAGSTRLSE